MSRRLRQHINPLKISCLIPREKHLLVPSDRRIEVELGCGEAVFLIDLAKRCPDNYFLGVDIRGAFLEIGRKNVCGQQITNIKLIESNLIVDAGQLFIPKSIHRYYINFPDPWFKRRHRNRRWLNYETLSHLVSTLVLDGEIFFQSDIWDLAIEALALFESNSNLINICGEWTFLRENPFLARSSRELSCIEEGRHIWRLLFRRNIMNQ